MKKMRSNNQATLSRKAASKTAHEDPFVIGRDAFASISAVEGIRPSPELRNALARAEHLSGDQRRSMIAALVLKK